MSRVDLEAAMVEEAERLGFSLVGVADPGPSAHEDFYAEWIGREFHREMGYVARDTAVARRADLTTTLDGVRSVIVVAHEYYQTDLPGVPDDPSRGVIARYARGRDYHDVVKKKLVALGRWLDDRVEGGVEPRAYVDTGPILERELAQRAGLGWFGKNTMLINPQRGSYFFIGLLLVDVELRADEPFVEDRCGTCRACLDACPTGALLGRDENGAPVMDTRRCISYLTIEHRGSIPEELRPFGNRIYGCDICQEVCPWNERFAEVAVEGDDAARESSPSTDAPTLLELMRMTENEWRAFTRGTAIRRAGYSGFRRNVAIGLGNWLASSEAPDPAVTRELSAAAAAEDPVVAEAAAWALGQAKAAGQR